MTGPNAIRLAVCAFALSSFGTLGVAHAQGAQAPFTIRRPPDGAVVREKVRVEIPRSSIHAGGFVAFYLDNVFDVAVAPVGEPSDRKPFTFVWDTKDRKVTDGPHTIRAVLYEPVAGSMDNIAVTEKETTSVTITVANKIKNGPESLTLRYKYRDGENLEYARDSKAVVVGGVSETGTTSDTELSSVTSKHQFEVQDTAPDVSLVRNRTTNMKILNGGQEYTLGPSDLASSLYQELDPLGFVHYETGATNELDQFSQNGVVVSNNLDLPQLPESPVVIGQTWSTTNQRLDIPGLSLDQQPKVTLRNQLEDLEWEGGYPTAKIHQSYKGPAPVPTIQFGTIPVTGANLEFERDIYLAYKSGTLVKTVRTLTVTGRTTSVLAAPPGQGATGAAMGGGGGFPGMQGGFPGMQGGMPGMAGGGMRGMGGMPGMAGGGMRGMGGMPGMAGGGMRGMGGMPGMAGGGMRGMGGMPGMAGMGGGMRGMGGMPGMAGMGGGMRAGGNAGASNNQETDHAVTLRSTTTTEIQKGG